MEHVLLLEVPPRIANRVRDELTEYRIEDMAGGEAFAATLAQSAGDLDALIVGPDVESPVQVAEQACETDPDIAVLILHCDADCERVAQGLRFSPFVGPDVQAVALSSEPPLSSLVADASIRARQRRFHRSLLAAVKSTTEGSQGAPKSLVDTIRQNDERFGLVVEAVADPIITVEADGRIHSANAATESVFGYSVAEIVGRPLTVLIPDSHQAAHTAGFEDYLRTGKRTMEWTRIRFPGRHKSGKEIPLELAFGEFGSGEARVFTAIFHDLTEDVHREDELRDDAARLKESNVSFKRVLREEIAEKETLARLADITARVDAALSLEEVFDKIFDAFATVAPYERMACSLVSDDQEMAESVWVKSVLPVSHVPAGYTHKLDGSSLRDVLETGRSRIINDLERYLGTHPDSENARNLLAEGMRSTLTCPLIALGKPVGFLFLSTVRPNAYTETHVDLFIRIAEQLSVIVERGRLWQQLMNTQKELEVRNAFIANVLARYTSDSVASQVLAAPTGLSMGGETRTVTVLFADLRGFTQLCAQLDPQRVVRLLNIHLGEMTEVVLDHGGTIDELMGDGILVIFGAPIFVADHARRAVTCAIAMQRAMDAVGKQLAEEGLPAVKMGIAVHTGTVVAGNIGCEKRAKYGVVGSAVNLATRIESFTAGGQILFSEDTVREAGDAVGFEKGPVIRAKGSGECIQTFSPVGLIVQPASSHGPAFGVPPVSDTPTTKGEISRDRLAAGRGARAD